MEFCPYCGSAITNDSLFCPSCGTDLSAAWALDHDSHSTEPAADTFADQDVPMHAAANMPQQASHYNTQYAPAPQPKGNAAKYVAIVTVSAALTFGAVFAYMYFGPGLPGTNTQTAGAQDTPNTQDTQLDQQSSTSQDTQSTEEVTATPVGPEDTTTNTAVFSYEWYGVLDGVVDQEVVDVPFELTFSQVGEDGSLSGICYIDDYGSYYIDGNVNWSTGSITINAREWANQGTLTVRRNFTGTISSDLMSMSGTCVGIDGRHESTWEAVAL